MSSFAQQSGVESENTRLLIVEDDSDVGGGLEEFFTMKGYSVSHVADGEEALREITTLPAYDLVLLDVMLPNKDGFEILREARRAGVDSPVIFLTVKNSKEDKLRGFELGADDYVTKPFSTEELAARVQAVLNRSRGRDEETGTTYQFDSVEVDLENRTAMRDGAPLDFTDLEFNILEYFIEHRGRTVSRKQLLRDIWGISGDITTRTIDRHVASLRKKIEDDPTDPDYIETVYGIGYRFDG
jgi:DNA-binding response OmpR family regulator